MQPREKLITKGVKALNDVELLCAILGQGNRSKNVKELACAILDLLNKKNDALTINDILTIKGMGKAKACQILAGLEFARRRLIPLTRSITCAKEVLPCLWSYANKKQEYFLCLSLNGANEIIKIRVVSIGLVNCTQVHPREVFAGPLVDRASSIIIAHNHPSGNLQPSQEDLDITTMIKKSADLLGIELLDHIIFYQDRFISFSEKGLLI